MTSRWKSNLPMLLTYSRAAIAPVILAVTMSAGLAASGWIAAGLFIAASLTDWLDGFFARRWNVESNMGRFMDPIADKILVLGAIVMLLAASRVDPVMVFLMLARDIFIGGLRSVAAANDVIISAKPFGKWKTALQMCALPLLMIYDSDLLRGLGLKIPIGDIGYYALWVSVGLSLISGAEYTIGYYRGRT